MCIRHTAAAASMLLAGHISAGIISRVSSFKSLSCMIDVDMVPISHVSGSFICGRVGSDALAFTVS